MIRYLTLTFLVLLSGSLYAQKSGPAPTLNENSLVRDSTGMQYPYVVWNKLFRSGTHGIRTMRRTDSEELSFLIYPLSEKEIAARMERLPKPRESSAFKAGTRVAGFKAMDLQGNKYNLKDLAGKVVVLNFWFINCPPCRQEIPELNAMVSRYKDNPDVFFLAVGLDEPYAIREFLKTKPFDYQIVPRGRNLAAQFRVRAYPTHVVLDKAGVVAFDTEGLAMNTVHWIDKTIREKLGDPGNL